MFIRSPLQILDAYFNPLSSRADSGVYFCRICHHSPELDSFLPTYYKAARQTGVVIEGKIPNPDKKNLAYYEEVMGLSLQLRVDFFSVSLKKWLPRMKQEQCAMLAEAIFDVLDGMRREGKNENILKNAYIKFMCWLYYKLERITGHLGNELVPKIFYEGDIGNYELRLFSILSKAGCDILLLQYSGEELYRKVDPQSLFCDAYQGKHPAVFPEGYSIRRIRESLEQQTRRERLYGGTPNLVRRTNDWISGRGLEDILKAPATRTGNSAEFCNCFLQICGVQDTLTYQNELYQFQAKLKAAQRKTLIIEEQIPLPSPEEIALIRRKNYTSIEQMLADLSSNVQFPAYPELQKLMVKAFVETISLLESRVSLNKQVSCAVYLLSWLKRYQGTLFSGWKPPEISCLIYLSSQFSENEALFLRMLARLPVDVLILSPNLEAPSALEDPLLHKICNSQSLATLRFPRQESEIQIGTAAFHAEQELGSILYQDSGLYRNQQYQKAVSVSLQTTYEEIAILWDQELKYRPSFSVIGEMVSLPVLFAKISGMKTPQPPPYWTSIKALNTDLTLLVKNPPLFNLQESNPIKAVELIKNKKLQKEKIKKHRAYSYSFLREEIQEHILDKLQLLLEQRLIRGIFENGMEYTVISTILNLPKEILRLLQRFDFTKINPKIIYINTIEEIIPLEDGIIIAFLNLVGFDILYFAPTGYQTIEPHFAKKIMQEHQIGDYVYDLPIPDFRFVSANTRPSWHEKLFGRG